MAIEHVITPNAFALFTAPVVAAKDGGKAATYPDHTKLMHAASLGTLEEFRKVGGWEAASEVKRELLTTLRNAMHAEWRGEDLEEWLGRYVEILDMGLSDEERELAQAVDCAVEASLMTH